MERIFATKAEIATLVRGFSPQRVRTSLSALTVVAALALVAAPASRARADGPASLVGVGLEVGLSHLVDETNMPLFGFGVGGALNLELNVHPLLGIHVGGDGAWVSRDRTSSSSSWYGARAGLRFHWGWLFSHTSWNDGWLDVHYDYGVSGDVARSGFDVGLGYELAIVSVFRLGPYARVQWASDPQDHNPILFTIGLSIGILGDRSEPADADRDHVLDVDDVCPTEPMGARPDPTRHGCPARDTDGDGVLDHVDQCPNDPAGARPDPTRLGCPAQDSDGDGVVDPDDQCPTEPSGAHPDPARAGCPAADGDGDGVFDYEDICPTLAAGARPDASRRGCPVGDRDGDSVFDDVDHCPDEPGAPSTDPMRNGCPGLVIIEHQQIRILRPVFFATNRDVILEESYPVLGAIADALNANHIEHVRIEGHTDNRGSARHNLDLSGRRAQSVLRWLTTHGISASALEAHGYGDTRPVETNTTTLGRAANRRVDFFIVDPNAPVQAAPPQAATPPHDAPASDAEPPRHRHVHTGAAQ